MDDGAALVRRCVLLIRERVNPNLSPLAAIIRGTADRVQFGPVVGSESGIRYVGGIAQDWRDHCGYAYAQFVTLAMGVAEGVLTAKVDHAAHIERWVLGSPELGSFILWPCGCALAMADPDFSNQLIERETRECVLDSGRRFQ